MMALHDRRRARRYRPTHVDRIRLTLPDGTRPYCRILDISPQGFKAELHDDFEEILAGIRLGIAECPPELADLLEDRRVEVRWVDGRRFGAVFESPLSVKVGDFGADARFTSF